VQSSQRRKWQPLSPTTQQVGDSTLCTWSYVNMLELMHPDCMQCLWPYSNYAKSTHTTLPATAQLATPTLSPPPPPPPPPPSP
jgi:hypothetical protein